MQENFQLVFNMVFTSFIAVMGLVVSYGAKVKKASNDKDKKLALAETLGAGAILTFLVFAIFAVGLSGK